MNPYGGQNPGPTPGQNPGGEQGWNAGQPPQDGYQRPGPAAPSGYSPQRYPQGGPGQQRYPQQGYPQGRPSPGQQYGGYGQQQGYVPAGPPGGPQGGGNGGGNNKALIIALTAVIAIIAVAGAVGLCFALRSNDSTTAAPETYTAASTTTGAPTTGAAPGAGTTASPQSDGFLPTTSAGAGSSGTETAQLKLTAGGAGTGRVLVVGLPSGTVPQASALPWEWQGAAPVGDRLSVIVTGTGPVDCSITINGQVFTRQGTGQVICSVQRNDT